MMSVPPDMRSRLRRAVIRCGAEFLVGFQTVSAVCAAAGATEFLFPDSIRNALSDPPVKDSFEFWFFVICIIGFNLLTSVPTYIILFRLKCERLN